MKTLSQHSDGYCVFYPYATVRTDLLKDIEVDDYMATVPLLVKSAIINIQYQKAKKQPGVATITLKSNLNYKKLLPNGTWFRLHLADHALTGEEVNGPDCGLQAICMVRSVRRKEFVGANGSKSVTFVISAMDHQHMLNSKIYTNAALIGGIQKETLGLVFSGLADENVRLARGQDAQLTDGLTPDIAVKTIMQLFIGKSAANKTKTNLTIPDAISLGKNIQVPPALAQWLRPENTSTTFIDMLDLHFQDNLLGVNPEIPQPGPDTTVWALMAQYAHEIMNELYTELLPDSKGRLQPAVVLRAMPFSRARVDASCILFLSASGPNGGNNAASNSFYISRHISESENLGSDFGKSDTERHNFFLVTPNVQLLPQNLSDAAIGQVIAQNQKDGFKALTDTASVTRYGLYPMVAQTPYFLKSDDLLHMNDVMRDMWGLAHMYDNGFVTLPGIAPRVPIGTNVVFDDRQWVGHIETYSLTYQITTKGNRIYRQNLGLAHILQTDGKFIDDFDESQTADGQIAPWDRGISSSTGDT